jgi:NAD(P)-dependent dehydrogenase (short-subunit alcohol dehydrogenase family)
LKGKTALVTGGGQGIGRSICLSLAEQGANVIINYRSNKAKAEQTYSEVLAFGVKSWLWEYDLNAETVTYDCLDFVARISHSVDILVLNASVQIRKEWDKVTLEEFDAQINVNLRASLELIQCCVPDMEKNQWGRILTLGSVQQNRPSKQMIVYAASKSAQTNMVKNLAWLLGNKGITINNIAPGVIRTVRNDEVLSDVTFADNICKKIPVGFIGEPQDIASVALLLCSEAGRYITGADIFVDGGMSLPE